MLRAVLRVPDGLKDRKCGLRPDEGLRRVSVVGRDETAQLVAECLDAGEDASANRATFELREPALDGVEPRDTGRREVQVAGSSGGTVWSPDSVARASPATPAG